MASGLSEAPSRECSPCNEGEGKRGGARSWDGGQGKLGGRQGTRADQESIRENGWGSRKANKQSSGDHNNKEEIIKVRNGDGVTPKINRK